MKKKIKVSINDEMHQRLMDDVKKYDLSIAGFNNLLIKHYLKNAFDMNKAKGKNEKIIQFMLDETLVDDYFKFFSESEIKTETIFLRAIYMDYLNKDEEERERIIKK